MKITTQAHPILVLMGVSGSGKSTIAAFLAGRLGWEFAEGDDFHPAANVAKMSAGIPLEDSDRWPWLDLIKTWIQDRTDAGSPSIVTCSALKKSYRDVLRGDNVVFVHLLAPDDLLAARMDRPGHFMSPQLLTSQLETFEPLQDDEQHLVVSSGRPVDIVANEIVTLLELPAPRQ